LSNSTFTYDPDRGRGPSLHERSLPVGTPDNRPWTYAEQILVWKDIIPAALRSGGIPETPEAGRQLRTLEAEIGRRWGWALNRLAWDREFPQRHRQEYFLPEFCRPGAALVAQRRITRELTAAFPTNYKGSLNFKPSYD
jgi:hypothetical protein